MRATFQVLTTACLKVRAFGFVARPGGARKTWKVLTLVFDVIFASRLARVPRRVPRHCYLVSIRFFASLFQLKFPGNIDFIALFYFPYFLLDQKVTKSQGFLKKAKIRRVSSEIQCC